MAEDPGAGTVSPEGREDMAAATIRRRAVIREATTTPAASISRQGADTRADTAITAADMEGAPTSAPIIAAASTSASAFLLMDTPTLPDTTTTRITTTTVIQLPF